MAIADQFQQMIGLLDQMNTAMKASAPITGELSKAKQKLKDEELKLFKVMADGKKAIDKGRAAIALQSKAVQDAAKIISDYDDQLKLATGGVSRFTNNVKKTQDALNKMQSGMQKGFSSVTGTIGKLTGALGVAGISFNSIVKAGLEYNRSLFEVTRSQQVAGKRANDLSVALDYVSKNTVLSRQQFIKLANDIQTSFLGLKPSLIETAKLAEAIGEQFGYSYEAQSKAAQSLIAIQNKQPALYDRIVKGMKRVVEASKGGVVAASIAKESEALKNSIALRALATDMDNSSLQAALQAVTVKTEAQNKLMQIEKAAAEVRKAMEDTQLQFYESLQPLIIKATNATSSLINVASNYTDIIVETAGAFVVLKAAAPFAALTAGISKANTAAILLRAALESTIITPALMVAAPMAALVWWRKIRNERKLGQKEMKKERDEMKILRGMQIDLKNLTREQREIYKAEWDSKKKENMTIEDTVTLHDEITKQIKLQSDAGYKVAQEYQKTKVEVEMQLQIINKIIESLNMQIGLASEFGAVNKEALKNAVTYSKLMVEEFMPKIESAISVVKQSLGEGFDIPLNITPSDNIDAFMKELMEAREKLNNIPIVGDKSKGDESSDKKKEDALNAIVFLQGLINEKTKLEGDVVRATNSQYTARVKQLEDTSSAYESNLRTQMEMMSAAQFGMGPQMAMIQKVVDLKFKMMKVYEDENKAFAESFTKTGYITEAQMKMVQQAALQGEAEEYINNVLGKRDKEALRLIQYAKTYQEWTDKSYKQQLQIYELTKDIREGYLDAMREMSFGAGEFEKIIGTQEMGVTQLMGAIKDATGEWKGNTMALGGMQPGDMTRAGIGTELTGGYEKGTGSLYFIDEIKQLIRNSRIRDYFKSMVDGTSQVGSGVVAGQSEINMGALKEGTSDGAAEGTERGTLKAWEYIMGRDTKNKLMTAVNPGVAKGEFDSKYWDSFNKASANTDILGFAMARANSQNLRHVNDVLIRPGKESIEFAPDDVIMGVKQHKVKKLGIKKVNDFASPNFSSSPYVPPGTPLYVSPEEQKTRQLREELKETNARLKERRNRIREKENIKRGEKLRDELKRGSDADSLLGREGNNESLQEFQKREAETAKRREEEIRKIAYEREREAQGRANIRAMDAEAASKRDRNQETAQRRLRELNEKSINFGANKQDTYFNPGGKGKNPGKGTQPISMGNFRDTAEVFRVRKEIQEEKNVQEEEKNVQERNVFNAKIIADSNRDKAFRKKANAMTHDAFRAKHGFGTGLVAGGARMTANAFKAKHGFGTMGTLSGGQFSAGSLGGGQFSAGSLGGGKFSAGSLGGGKFSAGSLGGTSRRDNMAFAPSQGEGSGNVVVTINLADGLKGEVQESSSATVQLKQASR